MDSETLKRIKRDFLELHPDDQAEDVADLIKEVERLQAELDQQVDYHDMRVGDLEAEIKRLQVNQKRLAEAVNIVLEYLG